MDNKWIMSNITLQYASNRAQIEANICIHKREPMVWTDSRGRGATASDKRCGMQIAYNTMHTAVIC